MPPSCAALNSFDLSRLRAGVRPFRLHFYPRLRSTSDHAAALRRQGRLFAPAIVLAGCQTSGRGRGTNTWWSARGTLTVTFVLPVEEDLSVSQLPLLTGIATRNAIAQLVGNDSIGLKWPNDLVYEHRKLGGLLCERLERADLIGLGLNVNIRPEAFPCHLRDKAGSLWMVAGHEIDMTTTLIQITHHLRRMLIARRQRPFAALVREYERYHVLTGHEVRVLSIDGTQQLLGHCAGIDPTGRLIVQSGGRNYRITSGHAQIA